MKSFLWAIILFTNNTITPNSYDTNNTHSYTCNFKYENVEVKNIFFTNESEDLIYIDFLAISSEVNQVKIFANDQEVLVEDVNELPQNSIYEVDLTILQKGDYEIQVHLQNEKIISELVTVF